MPVTSRRQLYSSTLYRLYYTTCCFSLDPVIMSGSCKCEVLNNEWQQPSCIWLTQLVYIPQFYSSLQTSDTIVQSNHKCKYHVWIFVGICDAYVCEFNVEELIHRMQRTTYAIQRHCTLMRQREMWPSSLQLIINNIPSQQRSLKDYLINNF